MPFIVYSVLRLALIGALGVFLYAVGVRDLLLPVLAILLALMVSYLVLGRQREAAAVYLAGRKKARDVTGERFSPAVAADAAFEDQQVDTVVGETVTAARPSSAEPMAVPEPTAANEAEPTAPTDPTVEQRPDRDVTSDHGRDTN